MMTKTTTLSDVRAAYKNACGQWGGCDWSTGDDYPEDLDGVSADMARERLAESREADDGDERGWERAAEYLESCQGDAEGAEELAGEAVAALEAGDQPKALDLIGRACGLESDYGDCPVWRPVREAIEQYEAAYQCGCGEVTGGPCDWSGPLSDMVVVEYMPEHLRASHEAAGNSGVYPHNGSRRFAVERSCAAGLEEGEWLSVTDLDPADYAKMI